MKIAIVSDLHLGYEKFADDAIRQAREALELASSVADAILLPGDIFDKRSPKPEAIAQAINLFREVSRKKWNARVVSFSGKGNSYTEIPVIAIPGTHERTMEGKDNPLNLLALAGLLVDTSEATTIVEKNGDKVAVFGLGGLSDERVKDKLKEIGPKPVLGVFSIFMFHQSIHELLPFNEDTIRYDDLPNGFDLYVCGHVHNRVEAMVHGKKFLIPGSTVLTQLKDAEQEQKGFMLFDTSTYSYDFVRINSREFVSKIVHFKDAEPKDVLDRCESEINAILSKSSGKPIIRLVLEGTIKDGFTNLDMPIQAVASRYSNDIALSIDSSRLVSLELESGIENIRESRIGNVPIKEMGISLFVAKLKEMGFDEPSMASELFEILSSSSNKEKVTKEAEEFLNEKYKSAD
jgi:DNA repair exonuclease SbcCD nuclease subunit